MKTIDWVAAVLLLVGGLNWGLVGLFGFNLVDFVVGGTMIDRVVYILVGAAAVWAIVNFKRCCMK